MNGEKKERPTEEKPLTEELSLEKEEAPSLDDEVKKLRQEADEIRDKYLRSLAETENVRKRMAREQREGTKHAIVDVMTEFLKPLDQFEHALKFADASSDEVKNWAIGFKMILTHFKDVLASHGIVGFDSLGAPFDPHLHEAVELVESEKPPGTIVEVIARGYRYGDRTLRPAHVKVAKAKEELPEQKESKETTEKEKQS